MANNGLDNYCKEILDILANKVKSLREKKGLSQAHFAYRCGLTERVICQIEKSVAKPNVYTLVKIAHFAGIPIKELFA